MKEAPLGTGVGVGCKHREPVLTLPLGCFPWAAVIKDCSLGEPDHRSVVLSWPGSQKSFRGLMGSLSWAPSLAG